MAEKTVAKKEVTVEGAGKSTEVKGKKEVTATDKPVDSVTDAPDENDIANVVMLLNEVQKMNGGTGDITEIPPQLFSSVKFLADKLNSLRVALEETKYLKAINDDLVDQIEDGQTPSEVLAITRVIPQEEMMEAYEQSDVDLQGIENERRSTIAAEKEEEDLLNGKFDQSKANIDAYSEKMGYDEAEKDEIYATINLWRSVFADGLISEEDLERIDRERNYEKDTGELRSQIPADATKEVLPDKASVEAALEDKTPTATPARPANALEALTSVPSGTNFLETGKRK
ncbi:hypothetical protein KAR91_73325, partial [Candidatus Pacearchaeota archaeon]|nr:hypothetical protein [Candidatus Pacearchaeota archaeon]